jgi:hypothetical protein
MVKSLSQTYSISWSRGKTDADDSPMGVMEDRQEDFTVGVTGRTDKKMSLWA